MEDDERFLRYLSVLLINRIINKAKHGKYYRSHKEQCRGYVNPEKQNKASRKWQRKNPDKVKAWAKRWRDNNPDKVRLFSQKRDFRKRNAEGDFTLGEWNSKLEEYNYRCAYCGCELDTDIITIDHVIPISRGGPNYIENLVPACRSCNSKKHTKTADEFLAELNR